MPKQSVAVQTSPKHFPSMKNYNNSLVNDITPNHFTKVQTSKLEDAFCQKTKPDEVTMKVLAMESNLLYRDVEVRLITIYLSIYSISTVSFYSD